MSPLFKYYFVKKFLNLKPQYQLTVSKIKSTKKNFGYTLSKQSMRTTKLGITPVKAKNLLSAAQTPLPKNFSWGDVEKHDLYPKLLPGKYLSVVRNQHSPNYLGICWLLELLQTLGVRFNIMYTSQNGKQRAPLDLDPQQILNCMDDDINTLTGSDSFLCYDYVLKNYIVDEPCKPITGTTDKNQCIPICYTCLAECLAECQDDCKDVGSIELPRKHSFMDHEGDTNYQKREGASHKCCNMNQTNSIYYIEGFSNITNRYFESIKHGLLPKDSSYVDYKQEIYANGPVTVYIDAEPIELYTSGILNCKQYKESELNHLIRIVGWGEENSVQYFIIENTWGTSWGESGYARIKTDCFGLTQILASDPNNINYIYGAYPKG